MKRIHVCRWTACVRKVKNTYRWAKSASQVYRKRDLAKLAMLKGVPGRWQPRLPLGPVVRVRLKSGEPVFLRKGTTDYRVLNEIFESHEYDAISRMECDQIRTVIDLGANIGLASRAIARWCPVSLMIAVEPDAGNCQLLQRNCDGLMKAGKLKLLQAFAAGDDGAASIDRSNGEWGFRMAATVGESPEQAIRCVSMPTILRLLADQPVDLLKCDIEGAEASLFATCRPWINRVRYMIVETHPPYSPQQMNADLAANQACFHIRDMRRKDDLAVIVLENMLWQQPVPTTTIPEPPLRMSVEPPVW